MAQGDITDNVIRTARHTSFYLAAGPESGTPIIFVHGWPELSISWRHQPSPTFANLGFRAMAPDMRGYGRSSVYGNGTVITRSAKSLPTCSRTRRCPEDRQGGDLGRSRLGQPGGVESGEPSSGAPASPSPIFACPTAPSSTIFECDTLELADRELYPLDKYPAAQWEYMRFYEENFAKADPSVFRRPMSTPTTPCVACFRAGNGRPVAATTERATSQVRHTNGWFGGAASAPDLPRDPGILTEADLHAYASALKRNGFFGPDSWYMNHKANAIYALCKEAVKGWLISTCPCLCWKAEYDYTCDCVGSRLSEPIKVLPRSDHQAREIRSLDGAGEAGRGQRASRAMAGEPRAAGVGPLTSAFHFVGCRKSMTCAVASSAAARL